MTILFVCVAVPILLLLGLVDKKSRAVLGFAVIGMAVCIYAAQINGLLRAVVDDAFYLTTTFTPMTEEFLKALPVLFYAFVISDKREQLVTVSMAVGIGFAVMENAYMLVQMGNVSFIWAVFRCFGAGLVHGLCTAAIGYGMSFVHKRRKLFISGTFALYAFACTYHSIYNMLVQSRFDYLGIVFPVITYGISITAFALQKRKQNKK